MGQTYRKSSQGLAEISTRALRLAPRLRGLLILVDGRRSSDDLQLLLGYDPHSLLQELLASRLIEATALEPFSRQASAVSRAAATPAAQGANANPTAASMPNLQTQRSAAVRALNDALGPTAESLAIRMERAQTDAELRTLLERGAGLISAVRGAEAGRAFAARFLG